MKIGRVIFTKKSTRIHIRKNRWNHAFYMGVMNESAASFAMS